MGLKQRMRVKPVGQETLRLTTVIGNRGTKHQAPWNSWQVVQCEAGQRKAQEEKEEAEKEMRFPRRFVPNEDEEWE